MKEAFELFAYNLRWMGWNLFLAIIPFTLSFALFNRRSPRRLSANPIWWVAFASFILFLPNAPYIITDIIHFVDDLREADISDNGIIFVIIPQYITFILLGFQCYVISMIRLTQYLEWLKLLKNTTWLEIFVNLICAIGVYLGRVNRLNSWEVLTNPYRVIINTLGNFTNPNFFFGTMIFFIVFTCLYYIFKSINIAIAFYWQNRIKQSTVNI